jgi:hypothetical protein
MALQFGVDLIRAPDEVDAETQIARGGECAFHWPCRRVIAAHRVNRDSQRCEGLASSVISVICGG